MKIVSILFPKHHLERNSAQRMKLVHCQRKGRTEMELQRGSGFTHYFFLVNARTSVSTAGNITPATAHTIQVRFQLSVVKLQVR